MYFYKTAILSNKLPFYPIYQSTKIIQNYDIVSLPLRKKIVLAIILEKVDKPSFDCVDISLVDGYYFPKSYFEIISFISKYYLSSIGEVAGLFVPFKKEDISSTTHKINIKKELSDKQKEAVLFSKANQISLLFGDTGSGKTEVYIHLIKEHIDNNKSCILLMPEISLTPQIEIRLKDVFGDIVQVWHSKLNKKQKNENLEIIRTNSSVIVVGARSALFLPINNLSLIIVDEEHDDSYKAISQPLINAKDVAIYMAKALNIQILLASATPSLNSYNKLPTFRLKGNFFNSQAEMIFKQEEFNKSLYYIDEIKKTLEKGEQVIVFVPTRANFKYIKCLNCNDTIKCNNCSVSMSIYHKNNMLKCHYCGFIKRISKLCQSCGFDSLSVDRIGTLEAFKFLKQYINANIEIFDRDNITSNTKLKSILKKFNNKEIDILVGTQMLSKGHDYHNIGLCVIVDIDTILNIADFRSKEKAISLFLQVSGRSGRKNNGKVIAITKNTDLFKEYIGRYEYFLEDEKTFRKDLYPPFVSLARLVFSGSKQEKVKNDMDNIVVSIKDIDKSEIVGYGECAISKIKNKFRYYILLRDKSIKKLLNTINNLQNKQVFSIDINPINFT